MSHKLTLEVCQETASKHNGKCLSTEYKNLKTNLIWQCERGHIWEAKLLNVKWGNTWCPVCYEHKRKTQYLLPYEEVKKRIELIGLTLVSEEYKGNQKKLEVRCICGKVWKIKLNDLTKFRTCRKCAVERRRQTNQDRYGVNSPCQNLDIAKKAANNIKRKTLLYHWKTKEELVCTGSYEKAVVEYLNKNKINYQWQPRIFQMSDGKTYRPDLFLPDEDKWIEIKGYFRKDAKEKWDWFHIEYPNSELWDRKKLKTLAIL